MISPSRELAFRVLLEVQDNAFAADRLAELSASMPSRDAGLATSLTLGVLRYQLQLDHVAETLTGKPTSKLDAEVLIALRLGIFQLRYLDRIPAHAAVGESVELVKRHRRRSAAGLVNAVLRKAAALTVEWPRRDVACSCPEWLLERWTRTFGAAAAESIALAALETPARYVHVPPHYLPLHHLPPHAAVPDGACATDVPGCFAVPHGTVLPAEIRVQDIGSQAVALVVEPQPGERVLDLCAAPGNKTAQLRESGAWVLAADISRRRLAGVPGPAVLLDAQHPLPFPGLFDRILVDAPCSGTGTIAHNPEIKWRLREPDLSDHAARQSRILRNALGALKPGGTLVYSTCSLEPEENEQVVEREARGRVIYTMRRTPGQQPGDGFFAAVLR